MALDPCNDPCACIPGNEVEQTFRQNIRQTLCLMLQALYDGVLVFLSANWLHAGVAAGTTPLNAVNKYGYINGNVDGFFDNLVKGSISMQVIPPAGVSAWEVALQGSEDNTNWGDILIHQTSNGKGGIVGTAVGPYSRFARVYVKSYTGSGDIDVRLTYA